MHNIVPPMTDAERRSKRAAYMRDWYQRNPEKRREQSRLSSERRKEANKVYQKSFYAQPEKRVLYLANMAKWRARKSGLAFDQDLGWRLIDRITDITKCECCKRKLNYTMGVGRGEDSPSLDRLNPSAGYVASNVHLLCIRCNRIKSNGTIEELRMVVAYMENNDV